MDTVFSKKRLILSALIVIYSTIITIILIPHLGKLLIPVIIYLLLITLMGVCAAFLNRKLSTVYIGALLFIISDSLIAINKFIYPIPYVMFFILIFYFTAQYKIGTGILPGKV